jgi:hypothetical protein
MLRPNVRVSRPKPELFGTSESWIQSLTPSRLPGLVENRISDNSSWALDESGQANQASDSKRKAKEEDTAEVVLTAVNADFEDFEMVDSDETGYECLPCLPDDGMRFGPPHLKRWVRYNPDGTFIRWRTKMVQDRLSPFDEGRSCFDHHRRLGQRRRSRIRDEDVFEEGGDCEETQSNEH